MCWLHRANNYWGVPVYVAFGGLDYVKMKYPTDADAKLLAVQQATLRSLYSYQLVVESLDEQASVGSKNLFHQLCLGPEQGWAGLTLQLGWTAS